MIETWNRHLLHPHELHIEALPQRRLKIGPVELVLLSIVNQGVGAAGIIRRAKLDQNIELRAIAHGFGLGDVDRAGIEI